MNQPGAAPGFRQRLFWLTADRPKEAFWLTGDRPKEAKALADAVATPDVPTEAVLAAASEAVSDAHGDSHVEESDPVTSDVASPGDVIKNSDRGYPGASPASRPHVIDEVTT